MYKVVVVNLIVLVESNIPDNEVKTWLEDAALDYCKYQDAVARIEGSYPGANQLDRDQDN